MISPGAAMALPVQCIPREFTPGEIMGTQPDLKTGQVLAPGQVILDERIDFLIQQGIPAPDIPTCVNTFQTAAPGGQGVCPAGSPRPGMPPNSAGQDALSRIVQFTEVSRTRADSLNLAQKKQATRYRDYRR